MTMSNGNHIVTSVPLDLTKKPRERGSSAQPGDQGRPRKTPERQVKPGCNNPTDPAGKPADSSFNNLPLRKRPFPLDVDHDSGHPKTVPRSPGAKVLRNTDRVLTDAGTRIATPLCMPYIIPGHSCIQYPQQYVSPQKSIPMPVPVLSPPSALESTDRLLADINMATRQDEDGDTPLHIAVVKENLPLVFWLIEIFHQAHKDLDIFNNLRQTPLHLAIITHQPILVKALLDAGSDPGALDRNGQTALHLCCEHGEVDGLSLILRHYSHNPSPHLEIRNYEGLTPLHLAVQNGVKMLAKVLLDSGAEINAGDNKSGRSALVHAVENNFTGMVKFLIERGCDVNAQSYSGNTALHSACGRGHIEIVRVLLKNGADSSLKNNHNDTAIMVAKNKKVSDVLRGKGTRSYTPKTLSSSNCSQSPGSSSHSPRMTPSASQSPVNPVLPRSQSVESISEHQTPLNSNGKTLFHMLPRTHHNIPVDSRLDYGMTLHTFPYLTPAGYDQMKSTAQRRTLIPSHLYYPPGVQMPPYHCESPIILLPGFSMPVTYGSPQLVFNQSRPSSRSSDQSDMSTVSAKSEERGVS